MDWMTLINYLIGGVGLVGLIVGLLTIRASRRKADAEADGAVVDTEQKKMALAEKYVDEFKENIYNPILKELKGLRRDVKNLRNAINKINDCPHADSCPVRSELQKQQDGDGADGETQGDRSP